MGLGFLSNNEPEKAEEQALVQAVPAAHLLSVYPIIRLQLQAMERALDNQMMTDLQKRKATPEDTMRAWQEKAIYRRILSRLEATIRAGGLDVPDTP